MHISYKGVKQELAPKLQEKLDAKFAKLSKLLEKRGEKEAHVIVQSERHLHRAEITVQFYDHQLVGMESDPDLFTALSGALEKLETQAHKQSAKWRDKRHRAGAALSQPAGSPGSSVPSAVVPRVSDEKRRREAPVKGGPEIVGVVATSGAPGEYGAVAQRVYRVNHHQNRKPMTLEEALLEMESDRDYLVYRDADKECVSVLVRRRDGHFDLIEG